MDNALMINDPLEEDTQIVRHEPMALATVARSEIEAQVDAAHKYPRSIAKFQREALSMATISEEVAQSCIYSLPRDGKAISGPSVRFAEIVASAWGNIHVGARPLAVDETEVTSQGVAWDIERNVRVTVETKRRIVNKRGVRFNEDMIVMTQNAASSIALRNAIFRVVPRAYVDALFQRVKLVAVGSAQTLATKRAQVLDRLGKMGIDQERILNAVGKKGVEDIGLEDLETLIGFGTAIKQGDKSIDELFPVPLKEVPQAEEEGRRMSLGKKKGKDDAKATQAPDQPGPPGIAIGRQPGEDDGEDKGDIPDEFRKPTR